ncbi:MAG TPA: choice-of-anchor Q domain-containing protein, partial [Chloroflexota bacterium]|nr:choice-of-anchor Q domain-containing protein [Chloroflexota bacterium]
YYDWVDDLDICGWLKGGGGLAIEGAATLTNVTLADNGGALIDDSTYYDISGRALSVGGAAASVSLTNSVVARGSAPGTGAACLAQAPGQLQSQGGNVSSDASCGFAAPADRANTDALLGPLAANGGPTKTHALLPGSPAIDGGTATGCASADQRGQPRPRDGDLDGTATCDSGAYEAPAGASVPLSVTRAGTGMGTVTGSPAGVACGSDCVGHYAAGTAVALTAASASGSVFTGWGGACVGAQPTCAVTVDAPTSVTATFAPAALSLLTVQKAGTGSGTVTSNPAGISCPTDCTEGYPLGATVALTATAATGSTFTGWGGACAGKTPTCGVTMDAAKTVKATFKPNADLRLTMTDTPDPVEAGQPLTYGITVTNLGPNASPGVQVTDALPLAAAFVSAAPSQGTCATSTTSTGATKLTCKLGTLATGASATVQLAVRPTTTGAPYTLANAAAVSSAGSSATYDPVPGNNRYKTATSVTATAPSALRRLVFQSTRDGNAELYAMLEDGTGLTRLTTNAKPDEQPAWSPDGTRLAFRSTRDGNPELYAMHADGSGVVRLTTEAAADQQPAWCGTGAAARIAFASNRDGNHELYVMAADGSNQTRLTVAPGDDVNPAWRPDCARIAFTSERDGTKAVYVVNADGTNPQRLTASAAGDYNAAWSPDGAQLVFVSDRDGNPELYRMNADGSGQTRLTTNVGQDVQPAWAPASRIAFASTRDGNDELYRMNADGSGVVRLTTHAASDSWPDWGPPAAGAGAAAVSVDLAGATSLSVETPAPNPGHVPFEPGELAEEAETDD